MKTTKKLIALLLIGATMAGFTACGDSAEETTAASAGTSAPSTTAPAVTTTAAATAAETTTTAAPVTTTVAPVTTTTAPVTTTVAPVTTTAAPVTTTAAPVTTTKAPVTTTKAPVTTTKPVTTTAAPVTTTKAPVTTTKPVTTTAAPVTTTAPVVPETPVVPELTEDQKILARANELLSPISVYLREFDSYESADPGSIMHTVFTILTREGKYTEVFVESLFYQDALAFKVSDLNDCVERTFGKKPPNWYALNDNSCVYDEATDSVCVGDPGGFGGESEFVAHHIVEKTADTCVVYCDETFSHEIYSGTLLTMRLTDRGYVAESLVQTEMRELEPVDIAWKQANRTISYINFAFFDSADDIALSQLAGAYLEQVWWSKGYTEITIETANGSATAYSLKASDVDAFTLEFFGKTCDWSQLNDRESICYYDAATDSIVLRERMESEFEYRVYWPESCIDNGDGSFSFISEGYHQSTEEEIEAVLTLVPYGDGYVASSFKLK